jgi:L-lactate dehydrogenase complex protein LldG
VTGGDEREFLFRRLSAALGRRAGAGRAPSPTREPAPASAGDADRAGRFRQALEAVGGIVLSGAPEENLPGLGEALRADGVTALFFPQGDDGARNLAEALVPFGPFTLTTGEEVRGGNPASTAGFRTADAGVAETGTVVESSRGGRSLLPGLLSDVHVALLSADSIVERMDEAFARYADDPPRNISLISGPSKTADIEQTLTVGAHGPKKLIVLLT